MANQDAALTVYLPAGTQRLPDTNTHVNRFEIHSASSDAVYIVSQSRTGRWWACGCFGFIRYKHCKHLKNMSLPCGPTGSPNYLKPYEAKLVESGR